MLFLDKFREMQSVPEQFIGIDYL